MGFLNEAKDYNEIKLLKEILKELQEIKTILADKQ